MTKEDFFERSIRWYRPKEDGKYYYYFLWSPNPKDTDTYYTFLIGDITKKSGSVDEYVTEYLKVMDGNGSLRSSFIGYQSNLNINIQVFEYYIVGGESMGTDVVTEINKSYRGESNIYEDIMDNGLYISESIADRKLLDRFWNDNKDWLIKLK